VVAALEVPPVDSRVVEGFLAAAAAGRRRTAQYR